MKDTPNTTKSKKTIAIVLTVIVVIIIAAILSWYFLIHDKSEPAVDIDVTTEDVQNRLPDMTKEDIDAIMNQELTDEQIQAYEKIKEESFIPEVDHEIEDDDPDDNVHTYIGTDGNTYTLTFDDEAIQNSAEDPAKLKEDLMNDLNDIITGNKTWEDIMDDPTISNSETDGTSQYLPDDGELGREYEDYPFDESQDSEEPADSSQAFNEFTPNTDGEVNYGSSESDTSGIKVTEG